MTLQEEDEITRKYNSRWAVLTVGFIAGVLLRLTGAISPVHEVMHAIVGIMGGAHVTKMLWNYTWVSKEVPGFFTLPYIMELFFYFLLSLRGVRPLGAFGLGVLASLPLRALMSEDYAKAGGNIYVTFTVIWLILGVISLWSMAKKMDALESAHEAIPDRSCL